MASKITLKQLGQDVIDFISNGGSGAGGGALTRDIISNVAVGAANAGTLFPMNQSFTDFAEAILLKDIIPTISATFSGSGVKEMGTTVSGTNITLTINNLANVTVPINEINFYDGNALLQTIPYTNGQSSYSYKYTKTIDSDKTFKAELIYNTNQKAITTGSFTFVYASYYGVTSLSTITSSDTVDLIPLFTKDVKVTKSLTWNNITLNDERFCYMYPASFGDLSSIKDGNGFNQLSGYTKSGIYVQSPVNGKIVLYNVYLLTDPATGTGFTQIYQ